MLTWNTLICFSSFISDSIVSTFWSLYFLESMKIFPSSLQYRYFCFLHLLILAFYSTWFLSGFLSTNIPIMRFHWKLILPKLARNVIRDVTSTKKWDIMSLNSIDLLHPILPTVGLLYAQNDVKNVLSSAKFVVVIVKESIEYYRRNTTRSHCFIWIEPSDIVASRQWERHFQWNNGWRVLWCLWVPFH